MELPSGPVSGRKREKRPDPESRIYKTIDRRAARDVRIVARAVAGDQVRAASTTQAMHC